MSLVQTHENITLLGRRFLEKGRRSGSFFDGQSMLSYHIKAPSDCSLGVKSEGSTRERRIMYSEERDRRPRQPTVGVCQFVGGGKDTCDEMCGSSDCARVPWSNHHHAASGGRIS